MGMLRNFMTAVQFLTVLPVSRKHTVNENDLAKSMIYFPFVGFLLGVILVYSDRGLLWLFPDTISNIFLLLISVLLTRALHVDGLADTIDGITGGSDAPSRLVTAVCAGTQPSPGTAPRFPAPPRCAGAGCTSRRARSARELPS